MKLYRIAQTSKNALLDKYNLAYPIAPSLIDGLEILSDIPNTNSISASFRQYEVLKRVRQVPMSDFSVTGKHYSVDGDKKIVQLAEAIKNYRKIKPLIVAIDDKGPYILEGATRIDALYRLGIKHFPALVVIDLDE